MKASGYLQLSAGVMVLCAVGHTLGNIVRQPDIGPGGPIVRAAMRGYRFSAGGVPRTMWDFYMGFNVCSVLLLLALAALLWHAAGLAEREPALARGPARTATGLLVAVAAVCAWWIVIPPVVLCLLAAGLAGAGLARLRQAARG